MPNNKLQISNQYQISKFQIWILVIGLAFGIWNLKLPVAHAGLITSVSSSLGLTNGLVGYWTFDAKDISNGNAIDRSGQNNTGAITGATKTVGKLGQALKFDGTNYVTVGDLDLTTNEATITGWVKLDRLSGGGYAQSLVGKEGTYFLSINGVESGSQYEGKLECVFNTTDKGWGSCTNFSNTTLTLNTWYYISVVKNGNGYTYYLNGVADGGGTDYYGAFVPNNNITYIGAKDGARAIKGSIDDVRVYNRALSAGEIKRLYNMGGGVKMVNGNKFSKDPNTKAYFKWESGKLAREEISSNNSWLTNQGGIEPEVAGLTTNDGGIGAIQFGSWDNKWQERADADLPSGFPFKNGESNTSFTIATWLRTTTNWHLNEAIWTKKPEWGGGGGAALTKENDKKIALWFQPTEAVSGVVYEHGTALSDNTTYFIAVTFNSATLAYRIHIYDVTNNRVVGTDLIGTSSITPTPSTAPFQIGVNLDSWFLDGTLDSMVVFNKVLTTNEIDQIMKGTYGRTTTVGKASTPSALSSCDSSVWYCDKPTIIKNEMGDGSQLVVAKVDIGAPTAKKWKTTADACVTPQCTQDGPVDGNNLVSDNTVDFSAYTARDACKAIGGRLPTKTELSAINTNSALFGSFGSNEYWSSTEYSTTNAWGVTFPGGGVVNFGKTSSSYVRCVKGYSPSSDSLNNGLVGYWTFNNKDIYQTTAIDRSGLGNNGTISGATKIAGKLGQGLKFNSSSNNYISISDNSTLKPTGNFTITAWIKPNLTTGGEIFQSSKDIFSDSKFGGIWFSINNNNKLSFNSGKNTGLNPGSDYINMLGSTSLKNNNWSFVTGEWDGSNLHVYVNGIEDATPVAWPYAPAYSGTNYINIGRLYAASAYSNYLNGSLDDVRIYNRALSASEIKRLYNSGH